MKWKRWRLQWIHSSFVNLLSRIVVESCPSLQKTRKFIFAPSYFFPLLLLFPVIKYFVSYQQRTFAPPPPPPSPSFFKRHRPPPTPPPPSSTEESQRSSHIGFSNSALVAVAALCTVEESRLAHISVPLPTHRGAPSECSSSLAFRAMHFLVFFFPNQVTIRRLDS